MPGVINTESHHDHKVSIAVESRPARANNASHTRQIFACPKAAAITGAHSRARGPAFQAKAARDPDSVTALTVSTWTGTSGNWSNATKWDSNPRFPNNGQPNPGDTYDAILFNGATITLNVPITIQKFTLSSGTVTGSNNLTLNDLFTWTGGTMSGTGTTNANGGILIDNATVFLDLRTLNNAVGQTATLSNPTQMVLIQRSHLQQQRHPSGPRQQRLRWLLRFRWRRTLNNSGTFTRNTGTAIFSIGPGIVFNNTGTVNVQTGTLSLGGGDNGSTTGDFNISSSATLQFGSDFTLASSSDVAGAGTWISMLERSTSTAPTTLPAPVPSPGPRSISITPSLAWVAVD